MNFVELLNKHDLKATPQRLSILENLAYHTHPTIDELYADIKKSCPSVSLATVYKNLTSLINQNIVLEVSVPNQKLRFDLNDKPHVHLICKNCGSIIDLDNKDAMIDTYKRKLCNKLDLDIEQITITITAKKCKRCSD